MLRPTEPHLEAETFNSGFVPAIKRVRVGGAGDPTNAFTFAGLTHYEVPRKDASPFLFVLSWGSWSDGSGDEATGFVGLARHANHGMSIPRMRNVLRLPAAPTGGCLERRDAEARGWRQLYLTFGDPTVLVAEVDEDACIVAESATVSFEEDVLRVELDDGGEPAFLLASGQWRRFSGEAVWSRRPPDWDLWPAGTYARASTMTVVDPGPGAAAGDWVFLKDGMVWQLAHEASGVWSRHQPVGMGKSVEGVTALALSAGGAVALAAGAQAMALTAEGVPEWRADLVEPVLAVRLSEDGRTVLAMQADGYWLLDREEERQTLWDYALSFSWHAAWILLFVLLQWMKS